MDVKTAYAVLKLKPEASLNEANGIFDAQAARFDPARVQRGLRPAAALKLAQVTDAWAVARAHLESGGGPVEPDLVLEPNSGVRQVETGPVGAAQNATAGLTVLAAPSVEAGWYPQPDGTPRYWDGRGWTNRSFVYMMSFPEAIKSALTKYVDFSGRARPSEYWWFQVFIFLVSLGLGVFSALANMSDATSNLLIVVLLVVLALPSAALAFRRLHDTDRSGWTCFINLIPFVGGIMLVVFMCQGSTPGRNRYGVLT
jgi:uncharacterized membrane protein YhaH (DUF805 family)